MTKFTENTQNTHNKYVIVSRTKVILDLYQRYISKEEFDDGDLQAQLNHYIHVFENHIKQNTSDDQQEAMTDLFIWWDNTLEEETNEFDVGVILNAQPGQEDHQEQHMLPHYQVYGLVCAAVMDEQQGTKEDRLERILALINTLSRLNREGLCHTNYRHELVEVLNKRYPSIDLVYDLDDFFLAKITGHFEYKVNQFLAKDKFAFVKTQAEVLTNVDAEKDKIDKLENFFATEKEVLINTLNDHCQQNGIDPKSQEIIERIQNLFVLLDDMPPILLGVNPKAHYVHELVARSDRGGQASALITAKTILRYCETFEDETFDQIELFCDILTISKRLLARKFAFFGHDAWGTVQTLQTNLDDFYNSFPSQEPSLIDKIFSRDQTLTENFADVKKDPSTSLIENFFTLYLRKPSKDDRNPRYNLWKFVTQEENKEKFVCSDALLSEKLASSTQQGSETCIELCPYEINRILLHALLISPADWTPNFYAIFSETLPFIKAKLNLSNNDIRREALYESYKLHLSQFDFLNIIHRKLDALEILNLDNVKDNTDIVIPCNLENISPNHIAINEDFIVFLKQNAEAFDNANLFNAFFQSDCYIHKFLHKTGILTPQIIAAIIKNPRRAEDVAQAIFDLRNEKIPITQILLETIIKSPLAPYHTVTAIFILHKEKVTLTPEILRTMTNDKIYINDFLQAIIQLHKENVPITQETLDVITNVPKHITYLTSAIITLHKENVPITQEILEAITKNSEYANDITQAIVDLHEEKVPITQAILDAITKKPLYPHHIAKTIVALHKENAPITPETLDAITKDPQYAEYIAQTIVVLHKENIPTTPEIIAAITKAPRDTEHIAQAILNAHNVNTRLGKIVRTTRVFFPFFQPKTTRTITEIQDRISRLQKKNYVNQPKP